MKIKEFLVTKYGPVSHKSPLKLESFNLFFGKNEEGKTLMIDAIVKLLLGYKNAKKFEHIDRVDEVPEGYAIIEDDNGRGVKLPEKGDLTKVIDLTPSECSNIFIIRNSELSIALESEFYTNVTDRLTGLRTEEISRVNGALQEIGKITPSGTFQDIKNEKLKTRMGEAEILIKKIEDLSGEIKEKGLDRTEEELADLKEDIEKITQKINLLEEARKREEYEKGKESLNRLTKCLEKLRKFNIYNKNDEQIWRDGERDLKKYNEGKDRLLIELKEKEKGFEVICESLKEKERDFQVFGERKKKIDHKIKPDLDNYEKKHEELVLGEGKSKFFTLIGAISTVLLGISLIGIIVLPFSLLFSISAGFFFVLAVVFGLFKFRVISLKAQLKKDFAKIKLLLSKLELVGETIEVALSNIQKFEEEYSRNAGELEDIKMRKRVLKNEIKKLKEEQIPEIQNGIKTFEDSIDNIKRKSDEKTFQGYTKKLEQKQKFDGLAGKQRSILESHFGVEGETEKENIIYWEKEIEDLKKYKERAKKIKYNEGTVSGLKEKKRSFERALDEMRKKMEDFQEELKDVGRRAHAILPEEEYLHCKTLVDLAAIKDKLQGFINKNESIRNNVLGVVKIFEEIETEEKEKISELFGKNSPISKYFNEITDGFYGEVMFNQETGEVEVKRKDGKILKTIQLSGGAYDQLYLSIRLALGEKLLKGKKGFFIMDDPFIKADTGRLQNQMSILKRVSSKLGWQILYFTAKDEVKNALKGDIESNKVHYVEISGISL